jgi:hypothetical protein
MGDRHHSKPPRRRKLFLAFNCGENVEKIWDLWEGPEWRLKSKKNGSNEGGKPNLVDIG